MSAYPRSVAASLYGGVRVGCQRPSGLGVEVERGLRLLLLRKVDLVEGIAQRDLVDVPSLGVVQDRGVHVEAHRHLHGLPGLQYLLREAEALDLREVAAGRVRDDVEARLPRNGLVRGVVRLVEGKVGL